MVVTNPNTDQARRSLTLIWPTPFCYRYAKPATVACWPTFWQVNNSVVSYFHLLEETEQTRRRLPSILNVRVKSAWNGAWHAAYDMSCTIYRKSKRRFPGGARCSACTRACVRFLILRTRCHRDRGFSSADVCVCVCVSVPCHQAACRSLSHHVQQSRSPSPMQVLRKRVLAAMLRARRWPSWRRQIKWVFDRQMDEQTRETAIAIVWRRSLLFVVYTGVSIF